MKFYIINPDKPQEVLADCDEKDAFIRMLQLHAQDGSRELHLRPVDPAEIPGREEVLKVRCRQQGCKGVGVFETSCAPFMVGALVLGFHSAHEGHPLEITYGDRTWVPPPKPGQPVT